MRLAGVDLAALASAELTYPERGATRGTLPPGYRHVHRRDRLGSGPAAFHRAVGALRGWRMHQRAGLAVLAAPPAAEPDALVVMRFGPPLLGAVLPCRVVYVVDEPGRWGFGYGTLPGHAERGEESFIVELGGDGDVYLLIRAFSRPAALLARAGGPVARAVQDFVTSRYVRALRELSR